MLLAAGQVRGFVEREIEFLEEQIRAVRNAVNAHRRQHPGLWKKVKLLETIPGLGQQNAARLLAELPAELETAREAAAYVGVTPWRNESGAIVRRSCQSRQGKASVRPGLYLAAMNAFRFNALCRALAERLLAKGMTKKAVVVAVMHKLLRIAFGVLKHQKPFDPKWAEAAFPLAASPSAS